MADPDRIHGWTAGIHDGPTLLVDVLCVARHKNAASLCCRARRADNAARLPLRARAPGIAWSRSQAGRRGPYSIGGNRRLGRVLPAAPRDGQEDWTHPFGAGANG